MAYEPNLIPSIPSSQKETDLLEARVKKDESPGVVTSSNVQALPKGIGEPTGETNQQPSTTTPVPEGMTPGAKALAKAATTAKVPEQVAPKPEPLPMPEGFSTRGGDATRPQADPEVEKKKAEDAKLLADKKVEDDKMKLAKKNAANAKSQPVPVVDNKISLGAQGLEKTLEDIYAEPTTQLEKNRDVALYLNTVAMNEARIRSEQALAQSIVEHQQTGNGIENALVRSLYVANQAQLANTNNVITLDWLNKSTALLTKKTDAIAQEAINQQVASDNQMNNIFNDANPEEKVMIAKANPNFSPLFNQLANDPEFQKEFLKISNPIDQENQNAASNRVTAVVNNKTMSLDEKLAFGKKDYIEAAGGPISMKYLTDGFFDPENTASSYQNIVSVLGKEEADNIVSALESKTMTDEEKQNYYIKFALKSREIAGDKEVVKNALGKYDETLVDTDIEVNIKSKLDDFYAGAATTGGGKFKATIDGENVEFFQNNVRVTDPNDIPQLSIFYKDWDGNDFKSGHLHDSAYKAVYGPMDDTWLAYQKGLDPKIIDNDRAKFKSIFYDNLTPAEQTSNTGQFGRLTPNGDKISLADYIKQRNASSKENPNAYNVDSITGTKKYVSGITPPTPIEKPKTTSSGVPTDISQLPEEIGLSQARGAAQADLKDYRPDLGEKNSKYNLNDYLDNPTKDNFISYKKSDTDTSPITVKKVPKVSYVLSNDDITVTVDWDLVDPNTGKRISTVTSKPHTYPLKEASALVEKMDKAGVNPTVTESFYRNRTGQGYFTKGTLTTEEEARANIAKNYPNLFARESISTGPIYPIETKPLPAGSYYR